jgi:hypothetical protein
VLSAILSYLSVSRKHLKIFGRHDFASALENYYYHHHHRYPLFLLHSSLTGAQNSMGLNDKTLLIQFSAQSFLTV